MKIIFNFKKITSFILLLLSVFILGFFQKPSLESLQINNYPSNEIQQYDFENNESEYYIEQIETGYKHTAAVISEKDNSYNDSLYMWGSNNYNQLGLGDDSASMYNTPQKVTGLPKGDIEQVSLGGSNAGSHSAAIVSESPSALPELYTWGQNDHGQLGLGYISTCDETNVPKKVPLYNNGEKGILASDETIKEISMGSSHSAMITSNGKKDFLYTWGNNSYGQLGLGTKDNNYVTPTPVQDMSTWLGDAGKINQISLSSEYSMMLIDSKIYGCGLNSYGQLGLGNTTNKEKFTLIPKESFTNNNDYYYIEQIATGGTHSAAIINKGTRSLYTWGNNYSGQLGLESFGGEHYSPQLVPFFNGKSIKQISLGKEYSTAVVEGEETDSLYTWGDNTYAQLGIGSIGEKYNIPQEVPILLSNSNKYNQISAGSNHTAILTSDVNNNNLNKATNEILYTWGDNTYGQLGNGKTSEQGESKPQLIASIPSLPSFSNVSISEVKEESAILNFDYNNENNFSNEEYKLCSLKVEDTKNKYSKTFTSGDIKTNPATNLLFVELLDLNKETNYNLQLTGTFKIPSQLSSDPQTVEYEDKILFSTVEEEPKFTETPVVIETVDDTATIIIEYSSGFDSKSNPYKLEELSIINENGSGNEYETNFNSLLISSNDTEIKITISDLESGDYLLKAEGIFVSENIDYDADIRCESNSFSFKIVNGSKGNDDNKSDIVTFFTNYWYWFLIPVLIIVISFIFIIWLKNKRNKII